MKKLYVTTGIAITAGAVAVAALKVRSNPSACPYNQRFVLDLPRPFISRSRLQHLLDPAPGQQLLEVGAGTGYYSLSVAQLIQPEGVLHVLDIQQEMLDLLMRRAEEHKVSNILPTQGDAQKLPYPDDSFDGAYLVATLGEVGDKAMAIRELRRVLRPGGRLVVGESIPDPHMVGLSTLRELAAATGFTFERSLGHRLGYLASFRSEG